jgi:DNA-binding transcriptional LysR family regulator
MVAEAELGLDETRGASARAVGTLRVSCTTALVEPLVAPVLADLARRHSLRADVLVDDRRRDLIGDGIDVGVRIGVPREAGFMLRQLGRLPEVLVARADLVAGMDLDDVETLRRLPWIAHAVTPSVLEVRDRRGQSRTIRLTPNLQTDCGIGQRALLLSGGGASLAILSLVAEDLAARRLVELLPGQLSLDAQVFLLLPSIRHLPARTRLFMDTVARRAPGVLARMHAARGQPRA